MGQLVEGHWRSDDAMPTNEKGEFVRSKTTFHHRVSADGSSGHPVEPGRYHIYAAHACPWAHRTLIGRALCGLEGAISVAFVHPHMGDNGWVFSAQDGLEPDPVHGFETLWQVYTAAEPRYTGRVTVPVLWDRDKATIVNNESREILRMLSTEFRGLATKAIDLAPATLRKDIDRVIDDIYQPINNGVYRAGFAHSQEAHAGAVTGLFAKLDEYEQLLGKQRYVCGDQLTEADICLFTTLFRFDLVYVTHFKCNIRRLVDYPNLWGYVRDIYQRPGVAATCDIARIKQHYFGSHRSINPFGLIPLGFEVDFGAPHGRG